MTDSLQRGRPSGSWPYEWRCLCWVAGRVRGWWLTDSFDQLAIAAGVLHCATWLTARHYCWATVLILRCLVSRWLETGTDWRHHDVIFYYFSVVAFPIVTAINSSATVVLNRPGQKQWRRRNFRYLISGRPISFLHCSQNARHRPKYRVGQKTGSQIHDHINSVKS